MGTITTQDGTQIFYKDWGKGQPIVFSHGWPLSADDWDTQMMFFVTRGYRVIAHDRRGHGRSSQVADGHDMDHYADDLAALTAHLDLKDAIHVGHSTGGGEVAHYIGRHGQSRVAKAVLISAVPPLMLKTPANPNGTPIDAFNRIQNIEREVAQNRGVAMFECAKIVEEAALAELRDRVAAELKANPQLDEKVIEANLKRTPSKVETRAIASSSVITSRCATTCITGRVRAEMRP